MGDAAHARFKPGQRPCACLVQLSWVLGRAGLESVLSEECEVGIFGGLVMRGVGGMGRMAQ